MTKSGVKHLKRQFIKDLVDTLNSNLFRPNVDYQLIGELHFIEFMLKNKDRIVRCYDSYTNIDLLKMEAKRAIKVQLINGTIDIQVNINFKAIFMNTPVKGHYLKGNYVTQ